MTVAQQIDDYLFTELQKITTANGFLTNPKVCNATGRIEAEAQETALMIAPEAEEDIQVNGRALKLTRVYKLFGTSKQYGKADLQQLNNLLTDAKRVIHAIRTTSDSQPFTNVQVGSIKIEFEGDAYAVFACEIKVTYIEKFGE